MDMDVIGTYAGFLIAAVMVLGLLLLIAVIAPLLLGAIILFGGAVWLLYLFDPLKMRQ